MLSLAIAWRNWVSIPWHLRRLDRLEQETGDAQRARLALDGLRELLKWVPLKHRGGRAGGCPRRGKLAALTVAALGVVAAGVAGFVAKDLIREEEQRKTQTWGRFAQRAESGLQDC